METDIQKSIEDQYDNDFADLVERFRYIILNDALDEDFTNDEIKEALDEALKDFN